MAMAGKFLKKTDGANWRFVGCFFAGQMVQWVKGGEGVNNKKYVTLELVKLFAAYMVVFIHVPFLGDAGNVVDALARFAVPLFFLISGFFSYEIPIEKIKKRAKHILKITALTTATYFLFKIAMMLYFGDMSTVISYFKGFFNAKSLFDLFVFNLPFSSGHVWYLLALIYVYIIFYFITKFRVSQKIVWSAALILLVLHILLGEILSIFGIDIPIHFLRNFALMGFPFFALGLFARKHQDRLQKVSNLTILIAIAIGCVESVVSRMLLQENELHIGSIFIMFALVVVFIKYADLQYPKCFSVLTDCSTYIYVFHIVISDVIYILYSRFNINIDAVVWLKLIHPIVVCIASTVFAICITQAKKLLKSKKK